jgi:hypothetical protein
MYLRQGVLLGESQTHGVQAGTLVDVNNWMTLCYGLLSVEIHDKK